ncbi:MAG: NAD-dependent epimerase/dehydratase family protein [Pedobacter sp.]|nr:MAG: NAD-dependent epimerase/dehydratase family protein [Pedobacter sp.]
MQTILGANGQIAEELAKELFRNYTKDIRLVSRSPKKVNDTDMLFAADLIDPIQADRAINGSEIAYFTLGLPMDTKLWEEKFPKIMRNVIQACKQHHTKLVFFDNTYMYPQDGTVLTEETPFAPVGKKGSIRAALAQMVLEEIKQGELQAVICRAPEFYGPGKTQSITNSMVFEAVAQGKRPTILLKDNMLRSLIWTPDASKATALIGNTPDAYGQTWHLPIDTDLVTYKQFIKMISESYGRDISYKIVPHWKLRIGSFFNKRLRELQELLPRYAHDNIFDTSKFCKRFPEFMATTYAEGIAQIRAQHQMRV